MFTDEKRYHLGQGLYLKKENPVWLLYYPIAPEDGNFSPSQRHPVLALYQGQARKLLAALIELEEER